MANKFLFTLSVTLCFVFMGGQAYAQNCRTDYEVIHNFDDVEEGSYSVWDTISGTSDFHEGFKSAVLLSSGHVFAAGEKYSKQVRGQEKLVFHEIDPRGRVIRKKEHALPGLENVIKMLPASKGSAVPYVVFANVKNAAKGPQIWVGFVRENGSLAGQYSVHNEGGDLTGYDVEVLEDGRGYILAASLETVGEGPQKHGVVYTLDSAVVPIDQKSYFTGHENAIYGIDVLPGGGYLATGYIYTEAGRKDGWAIKLDAQKKIVWQQQYPRGAGAILKHAAGFIDGYVVVSGEVAPSNDGALAAWLMLLDSGSGKIGWQRYYRGNSHYRFKDLYTRDDGLIFGLVDADPVRADDYSTDYIRLLSVNPRGFLLESEEYLNARGSDGFQVLLGPNRERIVVGTTHSVHQLQEGSGDDLVVREVQSLDGWVAAAVSRDSYDDPCRKPKSVLP